MNDGGRLTKLAVHECFRRIRAMMDDEAQYTETKSLELGEGKGDGLAAAEHVMDGLFDALDVCQTGTVDFCEFASGLSVRPKHTKWECSGRIVVSKCRKVAVACRTLPKHRRPRFLRQFVFL